MSSVVALQESDWTSGARAVVYEESQLAPLPSPRAPIPRFRSVYKDEFEVTWDAVPGAEIYVIDVKERDSLFSYVVIVPAGQPLRASVRTTAVRVTAVGPGGASSPPPRRRATRR